MPGTFPPKSKRPTRRLDELRRQHDAGAPVRADATQHTLRAFLQHGAAVARAAILHRALGEALRWDDLRRTVAGAVEASKGGRAELTPPTPEEVARLLDTAAAREDRLHALWCVAAFSGCRQEELLGLRWQDLDVAGGALHVRQMLLGLDGETPRFGEPKTATSRRTVRLGAAAIQALRDHRQRQLGERQALGPDYQPYGLVFARVTGAPLRARSVARAFQAALRCAGLREEIRFHDLRHAHITRMLQNDIHPKRARLLTVLSERTHAVARFVAAAAAGFFATCKAMCRQRGRASGAPALRGGSSAATAQRTQASERRGGTRTP